MNQCHMVIAADDITQRRETFFYPLNLHRIWQRIPQVLQFLVCGGGGHQEAVAVARTGLALCGEAEDLDSDFARGD